MGNCALECHEMCNASLRKSGRPDVMEILMPTLSLVDRNICLHICFDSSSGARILKAYKPPYKSNVGMFLEAFLVYAATIYLIRDIGRCPSFRKVKVKRTRIKVWWSGLEKNNLFQACLKYHILLL